MIDSEFKFELTALLVLLCSVLATVVACTAIDAYRDCQYIKAGYTHKKLPGYSRPQWVLEGK